MKKNYNKYGSILRKMRELKQKGEIDFDCISHSRSKYRKIPILTNINKTWQTLENGQSIFL